MATILKLPDVIKKTTLSRSSIYSYINQGHFPRPIRLGVKSVGWLDSEIQAWLEERANLRGGQ